MAQLDTNTICYECDSEPNDYMEIYLYDSMLDRIYLKVIEGDNSSEVALKKDKVYSFVDDLLSMAENMTDD